MCFLCEEDNKENSIPNLHSVTLCCTNLRTLPPLPPSYETIWLRTPELTRIEPQQHLNRLYLHTQTNVSEIGYLPNVYHLDISDSLVKNLSFVSDKLITLNIVNTSISSLPNSVNLVNLTDLDISNTLIRSLPSLPKLTRLYMIGCDIDCLEEKNLPRLRTLNCNSSSLIYLPRISSLEYVFCCLTKIKRVEGFSLNTLTCNRSDIEYIDLKRGVTVTCQYCSKLREIKVDSGNSYIFCDQSGVVKVVGTGFISAVGCRYLLSVSKCKQVLLTNSPWVGQNLNKNYAKIALIQRFFRTWYYHPSNKGGQNCIQRLESRKFLKFLEEKEK